MNFGRKRSQIALGLVIFGLGFTLFAWVQGRESGAHGTVVSCMVPSIHNCTEIEMTDTATSAMEECTQIGGRPAPEACPSKGADRCEVTVEGKRVVTSTYRSAEDRKAAGEKPREKCEGVGGTFSEAKD